jgi:hypothetical protein
VTATQQKTTLALSSCKAGGFPSGVGNDLMIVFAFWVVSLLLVWPVGNFPLNDDWAFARSVKRLLETGVYYPTPWAAMPLFSQTLWGALFCLPTGFSFNALRISTLVMSAGAIVFTYLALRYVHRSRLIAVFGALTLAFNPIYFALSCTFMTDVMFTGMMVGSAFFFYRNLSSYSRSTLLVGSAFALAATLCRQVGLATPVAFAVCVLWTHGCKRGGCTRALCPLLFSAGGLMIYQAWMKASGHLPFAYDKMNLRVSWVLSDPWLLMIGLSSHVGSAALYLGLFALPVSVLLLSKFWQWPLKSRLAAGCVAIAFVLCFASNILNRRLSMPITGNIIVPQGIGPITVGDAMMGAPPAYLPSIGKPFWMSVTILAVLGGALLVAGVAGNLCHSWRNYLVRALPSERAGGVFFLLSMAAYLFTILAVGGWDRYLMPALPLLLIGTVALAGHDPISTSEIRGSSKSGSAFKSLAAAALLCIAFFAICATHDYLSWNRARWKLLSDLVASGKATPADIDGGFEFNGWHLYDLNYHRQKDKNWWWVHGNKYLVALGDQPGYQLLKEYPYSNWMPPRRGHVLLLGKDATPALDPGTR